MNVAEGRKMAAVLASEATMQESINKGKGEAIAIAAKVSTCMVCMRTTVHPCSLLSRFESAHGPPAVPALLSHHLAARSRSIDVAVWWDAG